MAGRKKLSEIKNSVEIIAVDKMADDIATAEELYADGMPYELERIENEIRFFQDQAGTALLEMGKRLIRIKAHEGHGGFLKTLERLGMADRSADYAMLAARKFSNSHTCANLPPSKIRALTVLDEEDISTLESGGKAKGMSFDDIDRMSVKELRENLRKNDKEVAKLKDARKKDREAFEKSLTAKDAKLNEYELREAGIEPPTALKIAIGKAEELRREVFGKLLLASQYMFEAETLAEKITGIENITAEALTAIKQGIDKPYGELSEAYLALEDVFNNFFPEHRPRDLSSGFEANEA